MKKILSLALAGVFLLGSAAVAVAQESPAPTTTKTPTQERAGKIRQRGPGDAAKLRGIRLLHSEGVGMKADGSTVTFRTQKGIIKAVSASSITLDSPDGYSQTYKIDADTKVREKGQDSEVADLKAGEMAVVHAVKSGNDYVAKLINCVGDGARLKALQERKSAA